MQFGVNDHVAERKYFLRYPRVMKETIISLSQNATESVFRDARLVSADQLNWCPMDTGRSVLDQLQELTQSPTWVTYLLKERALNMSQEMMEAYETNRRKFTTLEECESECLKNHAEMETAIRAFPDSDLGILIPMGFGAKPDWPMLDVMSLHMWNCHYHQGQINYIRWLAGDQG